MTDTTVKYFSSDMSGAPALAATTDLVALLDACLVDGFGSVTLSTLVVAGNVATATVSLGHGFAMTGAIGPVITLSGATPAGLNGETRITVTSSTQFTFVTSGISDQTATGTITAKRSPAGWEKRFSGTNKAVYGRSSPQSTAMVLRVNSPIPNTWVEARMYEAMTDVDTGSGAGTGLFFYKSLSDNGTARSWRLVADDRLFYLLGDPSGSQWWAALIFGDIVPFLSTDAYHCLLLAHPETQASKFYEADGNTDGSELARSYTQLGGVVASSRYSHRTCSRLGIGTLNAPNLADNGVHAWPVECRQGTTIARGLFPGLYCPLSQFSDGAFFDGAKTLLAKMIYQGNVLFDLSGPWR